ncbi:hypothetical protein PAPHI01_2729, partial [Pancytospora philotis]
MPDLDWHYAFFFKQTVLAFKHLAYQMVLGLDILAQLIPTIGLDRVFASDAKPVTVCSVLEDFSKVMQDEVLASVPAKLPSFDINVASHEPVAITRFRIGKPAEDEIEIEIDKLLRLGIIRKSFSPWCSPALLVPKHDGSKRLCIDYRKLNDLTIKDAYPLPRIDDILDTLSGASIFSTLDATSGYYQIPIAEDSIQKTAFQTRSGLYEFTRMPFGLSNAPAAFQRAMDEIFVEEKGHFLQVYLDDIIVYSKTRTEHTEHLRQVLEKVQKVGLILKKKKCKFFQDELTVLGYVVRHNEVRPSPERTQGIRDFPVPQTITELRSFIGLLTYCSNFIEGLATKSAVLTGLLKGSPTSSTKITLTTGQLTVFNELKKLLSTDAKLALPDYDKPFIVITDASALGLSGILAQRNDNGKEQPVSFYSKKTSDSQAKYSATRPWCSRIVPVQKKDGSIRMCIDYRPLNKVTIRDAYPIPRIDEILDMLAKARIFSTLDATSGYYQLAMNEEDIPKTAFAWKGGLYEFTRMPFGLCNAPATFQRAMDKIFGYERGK